MSELMSQDRPESAASQPEPTNRIAIYVRSYSMTSDFSATQERRLREIIAGLNRYRPLGEVVEVFKDRGPHYDTYSRPGLRALMSAIRRERVTLVFVPEFRDLAMLPRDLFRLLRFFDRHRCGLRSEHEYLLFEDLRFGEPKGAIGVAPEAALKVVSGRLENEPAQ